MAPAMICIKGGKRTPVSLRCVAGPTKAESRRRPMKAAIGGRAARRGHGGEVRTRPAGFYGLATERIRSITVGSSGSKPAFGRRRVSTAQLPSIANTRLKSGSDSSMRPMFTSATACQ